MLIPGAIYDADTLSINTHRKNSINLQQNGIYMWHRVQTGGYEYTQRMWDNFLKKTQQKGSQWPCTFSSSPSSSSHIWNMCYATLAKKKGEKKKNEQSEYGRSPKACNIICAWYGIHSACVRLFCLIYWCSILMAGMHLLVLGIHVISSNSYSLFVSNYEKFWLF